MAYDKETIPPMFFSLETEEMISRIQAYHDMNDDAQHTTRYAIPGQSGLMTYYDTAGTFRIVLEAEDGYIFPDIKDIELLSSRIDMAVREV